MSKSASLANEPKTARRAGENPSRARGLQGDSMELVQIATRVERWQRDALDELADKLMMHKSDLVRKSLELGIEWGKARAKKLG